MIKMYTIEIRLRIQEILFDPYNSNSYCIKVAFIEMVCIDCILHCTIEIRLIFTKN